MRIEVLIGSEEPIIFPLKTSKVTLGSGESCDVILSASGVSRKHISITSENDQYFVTDLGSTNGSFINEERMVPGRRVEFTSFFPVRLGDNVLVSLLSDEDDLGDFSIPVPKERTSPSIKPPEKERDDSTTVINLKDLRNVKTETLVLERNKKREIRKKASQTKKAPAAPPKKTNYVGWLAILIVASAAYYNFYVYKPETEVEEVKRVGEFVEPIQQPKPADEVINNDLVDKDALTSKDKFATLINNMKCTIDSEIYLCNLIPGAKAEGYGVTQVGLTFNVFIDGTHYIQQARTYLKDQSDEDLLNQTAAYLFVARYLPNIVEEKLKDSRILIGFFDTGDTGPYLKFIMAFKPHVLNANREKFVDNQLNFIRTSGISPIRFAQKVYTVY